MFNKCGYSVTPICEILAKSAEHRASSLPIALVAHCSSLMAAKQTTLFFHIYDR